MWKMMAVMVIMMMIIPVVVPERRWRPLAAVAEAATTATPAVRLNGFAQANSNENTMMRSKVKILNFHEFVLIIDT